MAWSLYLVRTADGALYTGIARDVERRLTEHAGGSRGAKALRGRGPLTLAYRVEIGDRSLGQAVERRVKSLSKPQKEALSGPAKPAPK